MVDDRAPTTLYTLTVYDVLAVPVKDGIVSNTTSSSLLISHMTYLWHFGACYW